MAKLTFKRFRCDIDTDETGGESPYFVTWVGNLTEGKSIVKYTRQAFWDNNVQMGDDKPGPWWPVNQTIVNNFDLSPNKTLVLCLMVEEDNGPDLSKAEAEGTQSSTAAASIQAKMAKAMEVHRQAGFQVTDANFISTMRNTLTGEVRKHLENPSGDQDDLMEEDNYRAARKLSITNTAGALPKLIFKGDTGKYEAEFVVA